MNRRNFLKFTFVGVASMSVFSLLPKTKDVEIEESKSNIIRDKLLKNATIGDEGWVVPWIIEGNFINMGSAHLWSTSGGTSIVKVKKSSPTSFQILDVRYDKSAENDYNIFSARKGDHVFG